MAFASVIFAAGLGTRMKSKFPKVLHEAAGRALVEHVVRAVLPLEPDKIVIIVGHGAELVKKRLDPYGVDYALQEQQLGTGHALMQAESALQDYEGDVLVLNGDGPLLRTETLEHLVQAQQGQEGMTVGTCRFTDPFGMGRIVRDDSGQLAAIVEEKDTTAEQKAITEVNPGLYVFDHTVFQKTKLLKNDNKAGEYYVTDIPTFYLAAGQPVRTVLIADETEVLGVNDRKHLAYIDYLLQSRIRDKWLRAGVTMVAPEQTFIADTVELATDIVLEPGVVLKGKTTVGEGAHLGAYAYLDNVEIAMNQTVPPHTVKILRD